MLTLIEFTPTLDTSAYTSGDVLFDTTATTLVFQANKLTGRLYSIVINDKDDQGAALDVVLLRSNVSLGTVNATPSISDANATEVLGIVSVATGDYIDLGGCRVATKLLSLPLPLKSTTTGLWVAAITRGTPTHTASGLVFKLGVERD
jgi:hypothetical protein